MRFLRSCEGLLAALVLVSAVSLPSAAEGSGLNLSKVCGGDRISYTKDSDGFQRLYINESAAGSSTMACQRLISYFGGGCFLCNEMVAWRRACEQYCGNSGSCNIGHLSSDSAVGRNGARKLLRSSGASMDTTPSECDIPEGQVSDSADEESGIHLVMPGIILVCCGFMVPCVWPKQKDISRHNDSSNQINMDSSIEVGTPSEKFPVTPLRIPPSPSRFPPMSPNISRVGTIHLSINQILRATNNFSPSFKLGEGGFGTVYKVVLPDGQVVAVKRAKKDQFPVPGDEFSNEVELLAKIDHRNLVRLLGYVDKGDERILITEFVSNGTLRDHLDGLYGRVLDFNQRLEIAIGVSHALAYLHLFAGKTIIHRDVKSSNILLTDSYSAKVSDFGFAKSGPSDTEKTHISTKVKGTAGYLDPEYLRTYQLTTKSDVFSFGILLIEIISARRPVELKRVPDERITVRWAYKKFTEGNMRSILDPMLTDPVKNEVLEKLLNLAFNCAAPTREDRPNMEQVGKELWEIRNEHTKSLRRT